MKKKLYQKPNIKVHDVPKDALLAASLESPNPSVSTTSAIRENPPGPIYSKQGNLWGDDEE